MEELYKELNSYEHIIFDWNGTLLSDVDHVWESLVGSLEAFKIPKIPREEFRDRFFFPIKDFYQTIGIALEYHNDFNKEYHRRYFEGYQKMNLFEGTHELLSKLKKEGKKLSVLSASEENHLHEAVDFFGVKQHMVEVFGLCNLGAEGKASRGKDLLDKVNSHKPRTVIVGDTLYDERVGKHIGIETLLVADGIQSFEQLKKEASGKVLPSRYAS